jgi:anti-anti-sigma factor
MDRTTLALNGDLTIQVIADQRMALVEALEAAPAADLVLDLHAVHGCDSAGVQLLLSAHQTLQRSGRRLWLATPSPTLSAVLRTYGLQAHFDRIEGDDHPRSEPRQAA